MVTTKETAVLALGSAAIAHVAASRPRWPGWRSATAFGTAMAAVLSCLLVPPWKWAILGESIVAYVRKGAGGGVHAHPWYAYGQWMAGWHYSFSEAPILILGAAGLVAAWRTGRPFLRFLAGYTMLLGAMYSVVPYKTPWCAVSLVFSLALLGVAGSPHSVQRRRTVVLAAAVLGSLAWQAWSASMRYASESRNPWVYAQTGTGVFTIRDRVEEFARAAPVGIALASTCTPPGTSGRSLVFSRLPECTLVATGRNPRPRQPDRPAVARAGTGPSPKTLRRAAPVSASFT